MLRILLFFVVVGMLDEHLAEAIKHGTGLYFFLTLEMLILLHTLIRTLTIYYKRFCWCCFKNDAMQCIEKVYKQGWFIESIWQCRFCQRKNIRKNNYSKGSSSRGGGDYTSGGGHCGGGGDCY